MFQPAEGQPGHYIDVGGHKIFGYSRYIDFYKQLVMQAKDDEIFVEVGSFLGQSTAALGYFIKESGKNCKIYAVDIFEISEFSDSPHAEVVNAFGGSMYDTFCNNIYKAGVSSYVTSIKSTSLEAATEFSDRSISYLMIDASHLYDDVVDDITAWFDKVKIGGVISGDDYDWSDVKKAVEDTLGKVISTGSTWYIQKVSEDLQTQKTRALESL